MWGSRLELYPDARVRVNLRGQWLPASIATVNADATYDILYDDGPAESGVPVARLRPEPVFAVQDDALGGTMQEPWGGEPSDPDPYGGELAKARQAMREREAYQQYHSGHDANRLMPNSRVTADYCGLGYYHEATVVSANVDGTYTLLYDDGIREERVPAQRIAQAGAAQHEPPAGRERIPRRRERTPPAQQAPAYAPFGAQPSEFSRPASRPTSSSSANEVQPVAGRPRDHFRPSSNGGASDNIQIGSRVQGNWNQLGYWHPAVAVARLPGGGYMLQYGNKARPCLLGCIRSVAYMGWTCCFALNALGWTLL
eukprot:6180289-Pleurochrysis_carterae.AAC.2